MCPYVLNKILSQFLYDSLLRQKFYPPINETLRLTKARTVDYPLKVKDCMTNII